jgi:predicted Zn-dependent peptidase
VKYENDLKSIFIKNKSNIASVIVFVKVGAVDENLSQAGLSHFLEHLMFKGSKNNPSNSMSKKIENMGGEINAATSKEFTMYYINIQKNYIIESIKILADALENPIFPKKEIDIERKVVIEEIQRYFDNPMSVLYEQFYKTVYSGCPLKNTVIGSSQVIKNVSRDEIYKYYKTHYTPEKMLIVISGAFDDLKISKIIHETFGKFKKGSLMTINNKLFNEDICVAKNLIKYKKTELGYMITGFLCPNIKEDDIYIATLVVNILGGNKFSRLYRSLYEEKHFVYEIESLFEVFNDYGNVNIVSIFDPSNMENVKMEIAKQIEYIISYGIMEKELNVSKLSTKIDFLLSLETSFGKGYTHGYWHFMRNPEFIKKYIKKIENIRIDDIVFFLKKYYSPKMILNIALLPKIKNKIR